MRVAQPVGPTSQDGRQSAPLTQQHLVELLATEPCPPYFPSFEGNPVQLGLPVLPLGRIAGKRVLDVGCNIGLRCFQALAAGASSVVGIDANPTRIAQAQVLAKRLGLSAEFHRLDADTDVLPEGFDIVLCCGVLEHSRDPAALVKRLGAAAGEKLVIETEGMEGAHASSYLRELGVRWWQRGALRRFPIELVGRNGPNPVRQEARFYFNRPGLHQFIAFHLPLLGDVRISESPTPGRYIATATKRRIGHLVVIAGASGAGKSTLIDRLREESVRSVLEPIGLGDLADWRVASASDYHGVEASVERLCLHYDMNRAVRYATKSFARDDAMELLQAAERVTCLTLWAAPRVLVERKLERAHHQSGEFVESRLQRARRSLQRLRAGAVLRARWDRRLARQHWDAAYFSDPRAVTALYDDWFRFCDAGAVHRHYLVSAVGNGYVLTGATVARAPNGERLLVTE